MKIHRLLFEKLVFGNLTQPGAWQCVRGNGNISFATQSVFVLKRPHRIGTHRSSVGHIRKTRKRLLLTFSSQSTYRLLSYRWRAVANALGKFIKRHPDREFIDVPVDVSDCTDASVPENTFRFAKLPGDPHELIPNPFLLGTIRRARRPIQWKHKNDSLYFRGALTGDVQSYENPRVAAKKNREL